MRVGKAGRGGVVATLRDRLTTVNLPHGRVRSTVLVLADFGVWFVALYAGTVLRLDFDIERLDGFHVAALVPLACALQAVFGYGTGLYRGRWIIGSFDEAAAVAQSTLLVTAVLLSVDLVLPDRPAPLSGVVAGGIVALLMIGGIRYTLRSGADRRRRAGGANRTRALVFGAGDGGERGIRAMQSEDDSPFVPVALLDDDPAKRNLTIRGIRVVGDRFSLRRAAQEYDASALVITIPSGEGSLIRELSELGREAGLDVRVVPPLRELFDGRVSVRDLRVPTERDLLGRHQVQTDLRIVSEYLQGRRVVVTGAGGSIGSELCRQTVQFEPSRLVMVDRDESGLHSVQLSLEGAAPLDSPDLVLLDIRDAPRLMRLFQDLRPDVVFHAAALKHLPLLEQHPTEALKTNVWGTLSVLDAAVAVGVDRFVNISTDKAANPCNALGYTKRITEALTAHYARHEHGTYLSVRFGNVLGSRGSVLTTFHAQLRAGGPLTVTHPDVTRYFMTVEEAVQLVVQAAAVGRDGQVLVLDMGEPVRISEVARQLAASRTPEVPIVFTGLRPGEKLHEELCGPNEVAREGAHPQILHLDVPALSPDAVRHVDPHVGRDEMLEILRSLATQIDGQAAAHIDLVAEESLRGSATR